MRKRRDRTVRGALLMLAVLSIALAGCGGRAEGNPGEMVPADQVADYIHTVIEADRTVYADRVVHRLQNVENAIKASENFDADKALPLPAQMLRMGSQLASERSAMRYALISEWSINKANLPKTDLEKAGLAAVVKDPKQVHRGIQTVGGKRFYTAIYADIAVSPACANCHNEHAESPRKDFKPGDVMGGVVVTLPLP